MFLGEYQHTRDAKGRLSLPVKFRNQLSGSYVVGQGIEKCLYLFEPAAFEEFLARFTAQTDLGEDLRIARRHFAAHAKDDDLDSAGRINIPVKLREWAGLEREVTIIGNGNRVEIWDSGAWEAYNKAAESRIEEVTSKLAERGIL